MGVSDIFYFFCSGSGKGGVRGVGGGGGGGRFFIENPRRGGGGVPHEGEGPRGLEGVCGELGDLVGVGAKSFFPGPKCPPSESYTQTWFFELQVQRNQSAG